MSMHFPKEGDSYRTPILDVSTAGLRTSLNPIAQEKCDEWMLADPNVGAAIAENEKNEERTMLGH